MKNIPKNINFRNYITVYKSPLLHVTVVFINDEMMQFWYCNRDPPIYSMQNLFKSTLGQLYG